MDDAALNLLQQGVLKFTRHSLRNIQSLIELCGDTVHAQAIVYQRLEDAMVCIVATYGEGSRCAPVESYETSAFRALASEFDKKQGILKRDLKNEHHVVWQMLSGSTAQVCLTQPVFFSGKGQGMVTVFFSVTLPEKCGPYVEMVAALIAAEEERYRANEALRISEANYRLMAENANDLVIRSTMHGTLVYVSPASEKVLGFPPRELHGKAFNSLWPKEDVEKIWLLPQSTYPTLPAGTFTHRMMCKDGSYRWFETVSHHVDNNEEKWGQEIICASREVTTRKQAEDALECERERLLVTLRSITDGVVTTDLDEKVVLVNRAAEELTGWAQTDAEGKTLLDVLAMPVGDFQETRSLVLSQRKEALLPSTSLQQRAGKNVSIEGSCAPLLDHDGNIMGYMVIFRDQTEKQRVQAQLALSSKLQSIGQLAAGIAHEINTPMQFIGDNTQFLKSSFMDLLSLHELHEKLRSACAASGYLPVEVAQVGEKTQEIDAEFLKQEIPKAFNETISGIERVTKLVQSMKTFSHPSQGKKQTVNLNNSIEATVNVTRNEWKYVADLTMELDPQLPLVNCLVDEVNQVVLNMVTNSADAIQDAITAGKYSRGTIRVETRRQGEDVQIMIKDSGAGMPPDIARRVFDPFFTTKEPGRGTGQGLAICHDIIVNKHQGRIEVDSEAGQGTVFTISLPIQNGEN